MYSESGFVVYLDPRATLDRSKWGTPFGGVMGNVSHTRIPVYSKGRIWRIIISSAYIKRSKEEMGYIYPPKGPEIGLFWTPFGQKVFACENIQLQDAEVLEMAEKGCFWRVPKEVQK